MGGGLCIDFIRDSLVWQVTQLLGAAAKTKKQPKSIKYRQSKKMIMFFFIPDLWGLITFFA
jgi:hypothetical protein